MVKVLSIRFYVGHRVSAKRLSPLQRRLIRWPGSVRFLRVLLAMQFEQRTRQSTRRGTTDRGRAVFACSVAAVAYGRNHAPPGIPRRTSLRQAPNLGRGGSGV